MARSCIVREAVLDREYRVSPPERWESGPPPRPRARRSRRRRKSGLLPLALLGLALFSAGFLLGRALAAEEPALSPEQEPLASGEAPTVRVFDAIGAIRPDSQSASQTGAQADGWNLRLVNGDHPLPEDFAVPELTRLKNGHAIDSRAYPELQAMMDAARAAGYQPLICSSFRTWDKQAELFQQKTASCLASAASQAEAEEQAAYWVARPGTSEHQLGLAVDIVDQAYQLLDQAQEDRPVQRWLMEHCAEYGFILRYPTEKSALTGVGYEPWHYRYVGPEAAQAIISAGLCLEEYLDP